MALEFLVPVHCSIFNKAVILIAISLVLIVQSGLFVYIVLFIRLHGHRLSNYFEIIEITLGLVNSEFFFIF